MLEPEISSEAFRRNWARLIQKVFEYAGLNRRLLIFEHVGDIGQAERIELRAGLKR